MTQPPVCLITPVSVFLLDERVFPNLGILKVAAALEARGIPVEHLDLDGVSNFVEAAAAHAITTEATTLKRGPGAPAGP